MNFLLMTLICTRALLRLHILMRHVAFSKLFSPYRHGCRLISWRWIRLRLNLCYSALINKLLKLNDVCLSISSDISITPASSVKNLGVVFDKHLSFHEHITKISQACFFHIRDLRCIRPYLNKKLLLQLTLLLFNPSWIIAILWFLIFLVVRSTACNSLRILFRVLLVGV